MEYSDRYKELGIPYPDVETMCPGQCEGTGVVPVYGDERGVQIVEDDDVPIAVAWDIAHKDCITFRGHIKTILRRLCDLRNLRTEGLMNHFKYSIKPCDGWHFVKCPICNGSGRKQI